MANSHSSRVFLLLSGLITTTWSAATAQVLEPLLPTATAAVIAWDSNRQRAVLFGGRETWEAVGFEWRRITTAATPLSVHGHSMVFDSWRNRAVLFGGSTSWTSGANTGETWEYDGAGWAQAASGPAARIGHVMAFDPTRGRTVLFGGANAGGVELQDTWEFDGLHWTQASPAHAPSARRGAAMACGLGTCLLFGGRFDIGITFGDTWTWDGVDWQQRTPGPSPLSRGEAAMAFDSSRSRFVLAGGRWRSGLSWAPLADTWEFDGVTWRETPSAGLEPSETHAMAYDATNARVLLRGGPEPLALLGYTGGRWDPVPGLSSPPTRREFALAYDVDRDVTVHFGGEDRLALGMTADTWVLSGRHWTRVSTANTPPARRRAAMAYDARRRRIVLFGGDGGSSVRGDTWTFDGANWTQLTTPVAPQPRMWASMVHDPVRDALVLHGGRDTGWDPTVTSDTWELRGNAWVQTIAPGLFSGNESTLVFDRRHDRVLRIGGDATTTWTTEYTGSSWDYVAQNPWIESGSCAAFDAGRGRTVVITSRIHELDGSTWTSHATPAIPSLGEAVYDDARGAVVFVAQNGATWQLGLPGGATWSRLGPGCAGTAGVPTLTATPPILGSTMQITLSGLPAGGGLAHLGAGFYGAHWNGLSLPVDLSPWGMNGCTLWIDSVPAFGTWLVPVGSVATASLAIPNVAAFTGLRIFHQASVLDPAAPGGLVVSDAGVGTLR